MPFIYVQDVHERFRTESHLEAAGRFNERFLLSLASCKACVVMDDELNILPISSHIKSIVAAPVKEDFEGLSEAERDLKNLKEQLHDDFPVGPLIKKCCTLDQGKAVITFLDAILDKTLRSTIALLAARGRGKSAALGLAVAGAIAAGYSNVFVTAPSPENLKTLFEFICRGFDALEYKVLSDLENIRTTLEEGNGRAVSVSCWAEAAGLDVKVLQQQLRYGWYCRDELVRSTRSLVIFLARNYRGMGIALEDLIQVVETAFALEEAGCFSIVLVCVHAPVAAAAATFALRIPTIGIGAGPFCSGQDMRDLRIMLTGVVKQLNKRQGGEKETDSRDSRVSEPAVTHLQSGRTQGQNNLQGTPQTQQHQQ